LRNEPLSNCHLTKRQGPPTSRRESYGHSASPRLNAPPPCRMCRRSRRGAAWLRGKQLVCGPGAGRHPGRGRRKDQHRAQQDSEDGRCPGPIGLPWAECARHDAGRIWHVHEDRNRQMGEGHQVFQGEARSVGGAGETLRQSDLDYDVGRGRAGDHGARDDVGSHATPLFIQVSGTTMSSPMAVSIVAGGPGSYLRTNIRVTEIISDSNTTGYDKIYGYRISLT
jgi:hypothetical protein